MKIDVGFSSFKITKSGISATRLKDPSKESIMKYTEIYDDLKVDDMVQDEIKSPSKGILYIDR